MAPAPAPRLRPGAGVEVAVDAAPYLPGHRRRSLPLDRAVSVVDSGVDDLDGPQDLGGDDTDSTSCCSSHDGSSVASEAGALDALAGFGQAGASGPAMVIEALSVENSRHVQVGNSTHYHGPVTLFVSPKDVDVEVVPGLKEAGDGLVLSAGRLAVQHRGGPPPRPHSDPPACKEARDLEGPAVWMYVLVSVTVLLAVGAVVGFIAFFRFESAPAPTVAVPTAPPPTARPTRRPDPSAVAHLPGGVNLASRAAWGAMPASKAARVLPTPVSTVIVHHTATTPCFTTEECSQRVQSIQYYHMFSADREWLDIGYNFLVGGDGVAFEGRGWDAEGAHLLYWNRKALGVALIGDFSAAEPAAAMLDQLDKLLGLGVELGKVRADYRLLGACQLQPSKSPGLRLMHRLRASPHWSNVTEVANACSE